MAERKPATKQVDPPEPVVPEPPSSLRLTLMEWPAGRTLHRIHRTTYAPDECNPGLGGNARFSPIANPAGEPIPTLYGASTFQGAVMEVVFRNIPYASQRKFFDKRHLRDLVLSELTADAALTLVDLRGPALRKLGLPRSRLIDTECDTYPATRKWAQALHAQEARVQGLCWSSRQDETALAVVLFGDRMQHDALRPVAPPRPLLDAELYGKLLDVAERLDVLIVSGHGPD